MNRKLYIWCSLWVILPVVSFSQTIANSFKITNNRHPENETFYTSSILKADMEKYRLRDKEVTIKFENGFDCVMLSAKQLFLKGIKINALNYEEAFPVLFSMPVFSILQDGHLMAVYQNVSEKKKK